MKHLLAVALAGMMLLTAGCLTDDSDDSNEGDDVTQIGQLTMGGGVFYFEQVGYATANFGVFNGIEPYENAQVYVNGIELHNSQGIFTNIQQLTSDLIDTGAPVHVAVYALNDSVTYDIALPEAPSIVRPSENTVFSVGDSVTVEIDYPGNHEYISMSLSNQNNVVWAGKTAETKLTIGIPGYMITNEGGSTLSAISSNASGPIPEDFDLDNQYTIFLVSTVATRAVTFTASNK